MEIQNKRGWGAAAPRLKDRRPPIPRYGISPQLAPPIGTAADRECFNAPCVATPQAAFVKGDDPPDACD
jgi:hypothetical protein